MAKDFDIQINAPYNVSRINKIIKNHNPNDDTMVEYVKTLKKLKTLIKKGFVMQKYSRKLVNKKSKQKFGRFHDSQSCTYQGLRSYIRSDLMVGLLYELDINICHPFILYQLFDYFGIDCPNLKKYCKNREEIINNFDENKQFINKVCNNEYYNYPNYQEDKNKFFKQIHDAVYKQLVLKLKEMFPELNEASQLNKIKNCNELNIEHTNLDGALMANFIMHFEL